jgi:integrase
MSTQYDAVGLDAETATLLHVAFSRLLGRASGNREFVRMLCVGLAGIGRLPFRRADKVLVPALDPELPETGWSDGASALRRLRLTATNLDEEWTRAETLDGVHAVLPLETVLAFIPSSLWCVAAAVLEWGPAESAQRAARFWNLYGQEEIKPTRARPDGGKRSVATVRNGLSTTRRFLATLCELRAHEYPADILAKWSVLPPVPDTLSGDVVHTDRSAPPLILVRRVLRVLDADIRERRRTKSQAKFLRRPLRKRLVVALLAATGARIAAIARLQVRDYERQHRFLDGAVGPAIRIFPGKKRSASEARWKALPVEVADWLEEHVDFLDIRHSPKAPLWPSDKKPGEAMLPTSLAALVAGDASKTTPRRSLLPREEDSSGGYSAHTLRHLAEQLAYETGHEYRGGEGATAIATPQVFADALLDHAMQSDRLGYKDLDTPEGREKWGRLAALGIWEYVWGSKGARHAPDPARVERAVASRDELLAEQAAVVATIADLREQRRALEGRGDASQMPIDDVVRLLYHLSAVNGALDDAHEEAARVQQALFAAERELEQARTTLVPIDDDAPEPELFDDDQSEPLVAEREALVRDWLTTAEAARAFGVSAQTMRRWFLGDMPHQAGDPRNPWQRDDVRRVIQRSETGRKQRLIVSQLDRTRIAPTVMKAINEILTTAPR